MYKNIPLPSPETVHLNYFVKIFQFFIFGLKAVIYIHAYSATGDSLAYHVQHFFFEETSPYIVPMHFSIFCLYMSCIYKYCAEVQKIKSQHKIMCQIVNLPINLTDGTFYFTL